MANMTVAELESALYEERTLTRLLGMRRTMWVVPTDLGATVNGSSTAALVDPQQRRTAWMVESAGIAKDGKRWVENTCERVLSVLDELGEVTARGLTAEIPELSKKLTFYKKDGSLLGEVGASTRILFLLATEGRIVRAKPLGSWISSQYRWTKTEDWLGSPFPSVERDHAQADLISAWLRAFGPATELDMKWWTGWPVSQVRKALQRIEAVEVALQEEVGYVHPEDTEPVAFPDRWVSLLPSLDPTTMGWKQRHWYLGDHAEDLFDRFGNAGPTIWLDGRVVGGWAQRKEGEVVYEIFSDIGHEAETLIEDEVGRLQDWLGGTTVTARFRSPNDRKLSA